MRRKLSRISLEEFLNKSDLKTRKLFQAFLEFSSTANQNKKIIFAQGGFAVDLAVDKISRSHDDLDMIVIEKDLDWFRNYFIEIGYNISCHESNDPRFTFTIEKENLQGDVDSIRICGEEVSDKGELVGERFIWPVKSSELIWSRVVDKTLVKFASPYLIYNFKKRQQKRAAKRDKEKMDFAVLERHYPELKEHNLTF